MEYSPSCVFPTKLVSEYDDVFLFFFASKRYSPRQEWRKGKGFFWYFFFLQPLFYQPEFALFLCDLIFFFSVLDFSLGGQKEQVKLEKTRSQQK